MSVLSDLPHGTLTAVPTSCESLTTLRILVGDSNDRELVRTRCAHPVRYAPHLCNKCVLCQSSHHKGRSSCSDAWLNVMHFGVGVLGCYNVDAAWGSSSEPWHNDTRKRIAALLTPLLLSPAAATFGRIVVSLHSGLWDVAATRECGAKIAQSFLHTPDEWLTNARHHLPGGLNDVVAALPTTVHRLIHRPYLWRTIPLTCRSLSGGEDAAELIAAVSTLGVRLACQEPDRLTLVDWRTLSCTAFTQASSLQPDGVHFQDGAYDLFAAAMQLLQLQLHHNASTNGSTATSDEACSHPSASQPRCECRLCTEFVAFPWSIGRGSSQDLCRWWSRHHPGS